MSALSHVRGGIFDRERYTDAQAAELRQLRALYTTHLVPVFGPDLPDAFALRTEGNDYYPRYTATTLMPPPITPVPPSTHLAAQPYKSFADTLVSTLAVYEASRQQRWFGKGHPNDPTRLLGIFLRNLCQRWLAYAPSTDTTLRQVTALRQYLEALAREQVFTREGQGHGSMTVLLRNLATPLVLLEKRLRYEIALHSAREHFRELKEGVTQALDQAAQYLFCALAVKDRTQLPFSLVNMQARVVNKPLTQALETREGLLLKQWIYTPGVIRTLLPQTEEKASPSVFTQKPINLFGTEEATPLLDEKGKAHTAWLGFLQHSESLEAQFDPAVQSLPSGICPLLESKSLSEEKEVLGEAIQLHGLLEVLAQYQGYLHQCWQLAGFGGDHCLYDQMADAVVSILTELRLFSQALVQRLTHFQEGLDLAYQHALEATDHLAWQANYRYAKAHQEKLLGLLKGCETALIQVIAHAEDTAARQARRTTALHAYQALRNAPRFLNQARQQVGLAPKEHYAGLASPPDNKEGATPFALSLAPKEVSFDQILVVLLPQAPQSVAWLSKLCAQTPTTPPWALFRGTYQRYCYLHNNTRLKQIGEAFMHLQLNAQTPMTPEKKAFIAHLRIQLQEEQTRLSRLRQRLWWPFHRVSLRFFHTWEQGITEKLRYLDQLHQTADRPFQSEPRPIVLKGKRIIAQKATPIQEVKQFILPPAQEQKEASAQSIQASLARGKAILAQARETTLELEKRHASTAAEQKVNETSRRVQIPSAESKAKNLEVDQPLAAETLLLSLRCVQSATENLVETQPIVPKKPLSPATRERLEAICLHYNELKLEDRNKFAIWQQNCFGSVLFHGSSLDNLTEEEGVAIFDLWIQLKIEVSQKGVLSYEATEQEFQANFLTEEESSHVRTN